MSADSTGTTMRAAVYYGAHDVRIESVPIPKRKPGEALIRVLRSGICGSDATEWKAGPVVFPVNRVHPGSGHSGPMIIGHEFIGQVVGVDAGAPFSVGDRVASGAGISCGTCARCSEGRTNLCRNYYTLGLTANGGMAEYVSCPVSALRVIAPELTDDIAGLAQPLAVGLHAARRAGVRNGDRVVLIGAGAIGSFVLAALRSLVRVDVTVIDFPGERLERALRLGAARTIAAGADTREQVLSSVGSLGADVVIEASGAPGQLNEALALVRDGGTILQVGLPSVEQSVNIHSLVMREISVLTTLAHVCGDDLAPALEILATTGLGAEMLDSVHPLDDITMQLDRLGAGTLEGKVLFDPALIGGARQ